MDWQFGTYSVTMFIITLLLFVIAAQIWRHRQSPGSTPMAWLMLSVGVWALAAGVEAAAPTQQMKILWSKIGYLGTTPSPIFLFLFALEFTHHESWLNRRRLILLFAIPVLATILAWTNEWHHLIWSGFSPGPDPAKNYLIYHHGPFFKIMIGYFYALLLANFLLIFRAVLRYKNIYAKQSVTLLLGMAFPWIPNMLFIFHWEPIAGYDLTPVGFAISALLISWSILYQGMFDLVPVARELMIEWMKDALIVLDAQDRILDLNPAAVRLITSLQEDKPSPNSKNWIGQPAASFFQNQPGLVDTLQTRENEHIQLSYTSQGHQISLDGQISGFTRGKTTGRILVLHEVTQLKQAQQNAVNARNLSEALLASSISLNSTLDFNQIVDLILDQTARVIYYDYAIFQLLEENTLKIVDARGWENAGETIGMRLAKPEAAEFAALSSNNAPVVLNHVSPGQLFMQSIVNDIQSCLCTPVVFQDILIGFLCLYSKKSSFFTQDDVRFITGFTNQVAAALENARLFDQIRTCAILDSLTGLFNRRHILVLAENEINRSMRYQHSLSVIMIDIDHFKKVNDSHGHLIGDQVLRALSKVILTTMREVDLIGRYGGEEFVVIMPETTLDRGLLAAQRLCSQIAESELNTGAGVIRITASMGVAAIGQNFTALDDLLEHADRALYQAKQNGRNQAKAYSPKGD